MGELVLVRHWIHTGVLLLESCTQHLWAPGRLDDGVCSAGEEVKGPVPPWGPAHVRHMEVAGMGKVPLEHGCPLCRLFCKVPSFLCFLAGVGKKQGLGASHPVPSSVLGEVAPSFGFLPLKQR